MAQRTNQQKPKKGSGVYVTSTKDTTLIVNPVMIGTKDPEARFLINSRGKNTVTDSIYNGIRSGYNNLEASTLELYKMLEDVEKNQPAATTGNTALGYHPSIAKARQMREEKLAKAKADSIRYARRRASEEDLTERYLRFGDKPTYYVNGVEVGPEVVNRIDGKDIVERDVKILDTTSGNPNGELWFRITDKAAYALNLPLYFGEDMSEEEKELLDPKNAFNAKRGGNLRTNTHKDNKEAPANQNENVRKETTSPSAQPIQRGGSVRKVQPAGRPVIKDFDESQKKTEPVVKEKKDTEKSQPQSRRTRVRSRTVNNQEVKVEDEYHPTAE